MPAIDELVDQRQPQRILKGILVSGHIPNAFLFTGTDGVGKRTSAIWFAMAANCESLSLPLNSDETETQPVAVDLLRPCGDCVSCRRIAADAHPDVITVAPEADSIKISQIREVIRRIGFRPHAARLRAVIISDAHTMNREASNALLKVLEEPPAQTVFFLTAGQTTDLLPTVVSRCQHIRFNAISAERLANYLSEQYQLDVAAATAAAAMANGSFARAKSLVEDGEMAENLRCRRNWLIDEIEKLPSRPLSQILAFAERLGRDKKNLAFSLEMMSNFLRDGLVSRYCPDNIINKDMAEKISVFSAQNGVDTMMEKLDALAAVEKGLAQNFNYRLSLENMAMILAGIEI